MTFEVEEKVDLKPCPFCDGDAVVKGFFVPVDDDEINLYMVGCENCGMIFQQLWGYDKIVEQWNTRC